MKLIEEHYKKNYERFVATTVRKGVPRFLAEEIVQETYTQVLEYQTWASDEAFDRWFGQALNNTAKTAMKKERNRGMTHIGEDVSVKFRDVRAAFKLAWMG